MSAGGSLPRLFGEDGEDAEGQEDHAGRAPDGQAQEAAVHLHGLAALSRVEEGVTRDTPGERTQGSCGNPEPPAPPSDKHRHVNSGGERLLSCSTCLVPLDASRGPVTESCNNPLRWRLPPGILTNLTLQKS